MKTSNHLKPKFFYALLFVSIGITLFNFEAKAQNSQLKYYVVIGSFAIKENAERFNRRAIAQSFDSKIGRNDMREVYYVYIFSSVNKAEAFEFANDIRTKQLYGDCWVFNGVLEEGDIAQFANIDQNPETGKVIDNIVSTDLAPKSSNSDDGTTIEEEVIRDEEVDTVAVAPETVEKKPEPVPAGKPLVFKTVNGESGETVTGLVRLQEASRSNQYRGFKSNEKVYVVEPSNREGKWYLYCSIVGFKEYKTELNYSQLEFDTIISLPLERVKRGDYVEMDRVDFLKNASIMTPASVDELNELVAMMKEKPSYQIRIHGHTNGSEKRDVITLGSSTNLFAIDNGNKRYRATAKDLSKQRAEIVKMYLVENGVEQNRIQVKGDGGSQMIHGKGSLLSGANDRVEVEITRN
jgi:outer membrane protein OmpA-like peptidoglycan-associated protein